MIQPTPRCALLLGLGVPVALLPTLVDGRLWAVWVAWLGTSALLCVLDGLAVPGRRRLAVRAELPGELLLGRGGEMGVELSLAPWPAAARVELLCDLGPGLARQAPQRLAVAPGERLGTAVDLVPARRGTVRVPALWTRTTGPIGLVCRVERHPVDAEVPVVTDVPAVREAALRMFGERSSTHGRKIEQLTGDGSEFDSLREFAAGMDSRSIDWKASARHMKLLSRQTRAERNHQVVLAFDTGHLLAEPLRGMPRLDHAIHAGLVLGLGALRTGDRVGLFGFDARANLFVSPRGGVHAFPALRRHVAELEYGTDETNFTLGLTDLAGRLRRRSLVVVFTDFVDTVTAELMIENLERLARRHLVLFAALRDPLLDELRGARPDRERSLHRAVVADDFRRERDVVLERLRQRGLFCIDAEPGALTARLVNRYLDIKRRERVG